MRDAVAAGAEVVRDGIHQVGDVTNPDAKRIRIVHISDTHLRHEEIVDSIPEGDILIHSGDFGQLSVAQFILPGRDYHNEVRDIDAFFARLPHKHKLFVAGNHELNFPSHSAESTQELLKHGIYLQDSSIILNGLKFYGTPWNGLRAKSHARGFAVPYDDLGKYWDSIPDDTDVLITHNPPLNILDHGTHRESLDRHCGVCDGHHSAHIHLGCPFLRQQVLDRIRPTLHCFGHVHGANALRCDAGILFSNAAMRITRQPHVIDMHVAPDRWHHSDSRPTNHQAVSKPSSGCILQ